MPSSYQLPILLYHRIVNDSCLIGRHKIYVKEKNFRKQMQWLKDNGYETITFRDMVISGEWEAGSATSNSQLPSSNFHLPTSKKVILTFDDGYVDNYTILFPILKEFGFKAVIFLVTGCKRNDWGIAAGEPAVDLMTTEQMREMDAYGIEFGGHTRHHVDLKESSTTIQQEEITGCFTDLENIFGKRPLSFSYPFGAYNDETLKLVSESGFSFGITTIFGPSEWTLDKMRIRRIEISPKTNMMSFRRKVSGQYLKKFTIYGLRFTNRLRVNLKS